MESQTDIYIANIEITNKYFIKKSNTKTKKQTKDSKSKKPKKVKGGGSKGKTVKKSTSKTSFKTMMNGDKLFENPELSKMGSITNDKLYEFWAQSITNEMKTHNNLFVTPSSLDEIPKMMSNSAFYKHEDETMDENKQKHPKYHLSYPEIMDVYDVSQKIAETGKIDIVSELITSKKSKSFPVYVLTFYEVNDENMKFLGMVFYTMVSITDANNKYIKMFRWDKESEDVISEYNSAMFFFSPYKSMMNDCNVCVDMEIPFFNIMLKKLEKTAKENNCACIFTHPKYAMSSLRNIFLNNGYYESIYRPLVENFGESMKIEKKDETNDAYDLNDGFTRVSNEKMRSILSESEMAIKKEMDELEKISTNLQKEFEEKKGENVENIMKLEQDRLKQQEELALSIQKREQLELEEYYNNVFNEFLYLPPSLSIDQMNKLQRIIFLTEMYIDEGFVHNRINTRGTGWYGLSIADKNLFDTTFKCKGENAKPREYKNVLYKEDESKQKRLELLEEEMEDLNRNGIFGDKIEKEELQSSITVRKNKLKTAKQYLESHLLQPTTQEERQQRYIHENNERMLPNEINALEQEFAQKDYNTSQYERRKSERDKLWWSYGLVGSINPLTSNAFSASLNNIGYFYDTINSTFFCKNGYKFGPEIVVEKQIEKIKERHGEISNDYKVPKHFISFVKFMGEVYLPTWWIKPQYGAFDFFSEEGFSKNLREYTNAIYEEGDVVLVQTKETGEFFEDYYVGVILSITNKQNKDKLQKESWNIWGTSQWNSTYEILVKRNQEEYFVVEGVWSWNLKLNLTFMYKDVTNGHVFGISSTDYYPAVPEPMSFSHHYPNNTIPLDDYKLSSSIPPPSIPTVMNHPERKRPIPSMGGPDDDDDDPYYTRPYDTGPHNNPYEEKLVSATYKPETPVRVDRTQADYDEEYWKLRENTPGSDEKRISQPIRPIISDDSFLKNFQKRRERQQELKERQQEDNEAKDMFKNDERLQQQRLEQEKIKFEQKNQRRRLLQQQQQENKEQTIQSIANLSRRPYNKETSVSERLSRYPTGNRVADTRYNAAVEERKLAKEYEEQRKEEQQKRLEIERVAQEQQAKHLKQQQESNLERQRTAERLDKEEKEQKERIQFQDELDEFISSSQVVTTPRHSVMSTPPSQNRTSVMPNMTPIQDRVSTITNTPSEVSSNNPPNMTPRQDRASIVMPKGPKKLQRRNPAMTTPVPKFTIYEDPSSTPQHSSTVSTKTKKGKSTGKKALAENFQREEYNHGGGKKSNKSRKFNKNRKTSKKNTKKKH
tara:strand:+ start:8552 stop:12415 length:3864 start_codon:yes stop_codon:yes gene_type:complete